MMKNRDMPANPLDSTAESDITGGEYNFEHCGLTKREYAAIAAMQGLLAGGAARNESCSTPDQVIKLAAKITDMLFDELEKAQ